MSTCRKAPKETEECVRTCSGKTEKNRASSTGFLENSGNITFHSNILPIIPSKPEKYKPMPYTFRIPLVTLSAPVKNGLVKAPPFYLQLDHALAVIWTLFTKHSLPKEVGIVQLQWALAFLRNVRNTKGEYSKDVKLCIQAIEDQLLELYAEMVDEVKKIPKKKKSCSTCCKKSSSTGSVDDVDITLKQNYIKKNVPFSINYVDLLKRNAALRPKITKQSLISSKSCGSTVSTNAPKSQETTQMIEFLNTWRSEQIRKIEGELKRLHSIENFIANTNKNNFQPYLENNSVNALSNKCPAEKGNSKTTCRKNER